MINQVLVVKKSLSGQKNIKPHEKKNHVELNLQKQNIALIQYKLTIKQHHIISGKIFHLITEANSQRYN